MANQVIEYQCLLISPSDVNSERDALTDLIFLWNAQVGKGLNARINLVRWESHAVPDMSMPAQNAINEQIVDDCDLGIAVFWSRLGTATAEHASGSVEEIYRLLGRDVRVLVYFSKKDIPQAALRDNQFQALQDTKKTFREKGLLAEYRDIAELRELVNLHLTNIVTQMLGKDRTASSFVPASGTVTAPTPDLRVIANPAIITNHFGPASTVLGVNVQNHSPVTVYFNSVGFELDNGHTLLVQQDFITGEQMLRKRELHAGDDLTFYFDPQKLAEHSDHIVSAVVKDAIGRIYRGKDQDIRGMLKLIFGTGGSNV